MIVGWKWSSHVTTFMTIKGMMIKLQWLLYCDDYWESLVGDNCLIVIAVKALEIQFIQRISFLPKHYCLGDNSVRNLILSSDSWGNLYFIH